MRALFDFHLTPIQGIIWTTFQGQQHKFPHKGIFAQTSNMPLYGTNFLKNVKFINFKKNADCGMNHVAIGNYVAQHDHQEFYQKLISFISLTPTLAGGLCKDQRR